MAPVRHIERPPQFAVLVRQFEGKKAPRLIELITKTRDPAPGGRYRHWDGLRHLKPPQGMSVDEWWVGIKFARLNLLRELPLHDVKGAPFKYALVDPALEMIHEIDQQAGSKFGHSEPEALTDPRRRDQYLVSSLMEEAITSSQLEGATTTREVAKEMIRSGRPPKDRDERMIANNYRAMLLTREHKDKPLTSEFIFNLHRVVTEGTLDDPDAAGRFRKADEAIVVWDEERAQVIHAPPNAEELPARLEAMCRFANGTDNAQGYMPPVVRAILLHFWLAYDHPFVDGNGRTARALFYWSMLKEGFWLCEYISLSRALKKARPSYMRSFVYAESDQNDTTYFVLSQLAFIIRAVRQLHEYIEMKAAERRKLMGLLRSSSPEFNHRQLALLTHAVKHPNEVYTVASHQTTQRVSYMTARNDLMDLEKKGFLFRRKIYGKTVSYIATDDLERKLAKKR